jgi:hypothetical protein
MLQVRLVGKDGIHTAAGGNDLGLVHEHVLAEPASAHEKNVQ